ncbi:MAG TPA: hypothetical protein VG269_17495 [Tepidisphaeraceae bacterium]|jgi:hypothetical protein|nr:hypothetical protein [Tepidisphaeraceae bacterium]
MMILWIILSGVVALLGWGWLVGRLLGLDDGPPPGWDDYPVDSEWPVDWDQFPE